MVGLGQAEASDRFAARHRRQVFLFLRLGAELVDRQHDQRGLHAHHGAESGIDALNLTRDQTVTHIVETRAAIGLGDGRAQQSYLAHFLENPRIGVLAPECVEHAWAQPGLAHSRAAASRIIFFVVRQLRIEQQRIVPMKLFLVVPYLANPGFFVPAKDRILRRGPARRKRPFDRKSNKWLAEGGNRTPVGRRLQHPTPRLRQGVDFRLHCAGAAAALSWAAVGPGRCAGSKRSRGRRWIQEKRNRGLRRADCFSQEP